MIAPVTSFLTQQAISSGIPIRRFDPSIQDGHLMLVEPGASTSTLSGVPGADQACDNLVDGEAMRLLGLSLASRSQVLPIFKKGSKTDVSVFKMERTTQGGLHIIASQTADTEQTYGHFLAPDAIRQFIISNSERRTNAPTTGHRFAMFVWRRVTRQEITANGTSNQNTYGPVLPHASMTTAGATQTLQFNALTVNAPYGGGTQSITDTGQFCNIDPSANALNVPLLRGGMYNSMGDASAPALPSFFVNAGVGPFGAFANAVYKNTSPSMVLYRWEVIDLTVSQLTYFDAAQLNKREFARAFSQKGTVLPGFIYTQGNVPKIVQPYTMPSNGRYYNDNVPTNPAAIA